jgi:hypothetical protein
MFGFEIGFNAGCGVLKICQMTNQYHTPKALKLAITRTFAWSKKVIGKRERDQAAQGQDEEREELSL